MQTVTIPAGTHRVTSAVRLRSDVRILGAIGFAPDQAPEFDHSGCTVIDSDGGFRADGTLDDPDPA